MAFDDVPFPTRADAFFAFIRSEVLEAIAEASVPPEPRTIGASDDLRATDYVVMTTSASALNFRARTNAAVPVPVGHSGELLQRGAGIATFIGETGVLVTVRPGSSASTTGANTSVPWLKVAADEYLVG